MYHNMVKDVSVWYAITCQANKNRNLRKADRQLRGQKRAVPPTLTVGGCKTYRPRKFRKVPRRL